MKSIYRSLFILTLLSMAFSSCTSSPPGRVTRITMQQAQLGLTQPVQPSGQHLVPYTPPLARGTTIHEVAPMESIWRISKMYDVSQESIIRANNLVSTDLKVGQQLSIPNAAPIRPLISLYPNNRWKFIVVHHTASEIGNARLVDQWHQDRGFQYGLGYHFLVDNGTLGKLDGQIETSPRWIKQEKGAHCKAGDMNEKGIGVSLVGNFSNSQPSEAQMESLVFLVRELMNYYNIPPYRIIGHRDAPGAETECPGNYFPWAEFKQRIQ